MRMLALAAVTAGLAGCSPSGVFLTESTPVPKVSALNQDGKRVALQDACSGPWALVFFYPEADTPG